MKKSKKKVDKKLAEQAKMPPSLHDEIIDLAEKIGKLEKLEMLLALTTLISKTCLISARQKFDT